MTFLGSIGNRRGRLFMSLLMVGCCLFVSGVLTGCDFDKKSAPAVMRAPEVCVVVVKTQPVTLSNEVAGRTRAYQVAEVRPQVTGILKARHFVEGKDVKAGQTLYQIDPETYQAQYESALAAYDRAVANVKPLQLKARRYQELVKTKAVSSQESTDMQAAFHQAQADVNVARAAVRTAKIRLDYTRVTSPISGRTGISTVTPGALVTENQPTAMTTVQQLDPMYVDITQSSVEVLKMRRELASGRIKLGKDHAVVKLRLEDGTEYPLTGELQFTDITVDRSTGMVTIRALFPNPDMQLLPNMYVRAFISVGTDQEGILVPQQALLRDPKGRPFVYVVGEGDKIAVKNVEASRMLKDQWVVDSGLTPGDRVVVEGLQRIRPGAVVKVVDGQKPASSNASM